MAKTRYISIILYNIFLQTINIIKMYFDIWFYDGSTLDPLSLRKVKMKIWVCCWIERSSNLCESTNRENERMVENDSVTEKKPRIRPIVRLGFFLISHSNYVRYLDTLFIWIWIWRIRITVLVGYFQLALFLIWNRCSSSPSYTC